MERALRIYRTSQRELRRKGISEATRKHWLDAQAFAMSTMLFGD